MMMDMIRCCLFGGSEMVREGQVEWVALWMAMSAPETRESGS